MLPAVGGLELLVIAAVALIWYFVYVRSRIDREYAFILLVQRMISRDFFGRGLEVTELEQAQSLLTPLLGPAAGVVFAVSLLLAGLASSVTAGMAGGSIFAGIFGEPYDIRDSHSRMGVAVTLVGGAAAILLVGDPLKGLIWSQIALSMQLPVTVVLQISLTSRKAVMGSYANRPSTTLVLVLVALTVIVLNLMLLAETLFS